jgi:hypothetical protein
LGGRKSKDKGHLPSGLSLSNPRPSCLPLWASRDLERLSLKEKACRSLVPHDEVVVVVSVGLHPTTPWRELLLNECCSVSHRQVIHVVSRAGSNKLTLASLDMRESRRPSSHDSVSMKLGQASERPRSIRIVPSPVLGVCSVGYCTPYCVCTSRPSCLVVRAVAFEAVAKSGERYFTVCMD